MRTTFILSSVLALAGFVSSADICPYTSRSCVGTYGCCYGIAEGTCCTWPSNYGWSVRYQNMPLTPYWLGKAYGDTCSTQTSGVGSSSGSACGSVYTGPTYLNWKSGNWDADYRTRRDLENREQAQSECAQINVIGFTTEDGDDHLVKIPEGRFDEVNEFVKTNNFEELLKLESVYGDE